ncbi:MAG: hypothetical protein M1816_008220 [Peltula sp. TS41687]|nr:MAG: hypothetical protein M1816_008220 [Peltula sp. TS41687]
MAILATVNPSMIIKKTNSSSSISESIQVSWHFPVRNQQQNVPRKVDSRYQTPIVSDYFLSASKDTGDMGV